MVQASLRLKPIRDFGLSQRGLGRFSRREKVRNGGGLGSAARPLGCPGASRMPVAGGRTKKISTMNTKAR